MLPSFQRAFVFRFFVFNETLWFLSFWRFDFFVDTLVFGYFSLCLQRVQLAATFARGYYPPPPMLEMVWKMAVIMR